MMRTATLAAAIQRDLLRTEPVGTETPECACGRPFIPRPSTGNDPLQGSSQLSHGTKRRGFAGWVIDCFGCGKEFDRRCR